MKSLKALLVGLVIMLAVSSVSFAQDRFRVSASFVNSELPGTSEDPIKNLQGINVEGDAKVYTSGGFRIGGVAGFQRILGKDGLQDVDRYSFGPRLSYRLGPIEPFGGVQFGLKTSDDPAFDKEYVRVWTAGVDVPFTKSSNVAVRPFFIEREFSGGFNQNGVTKYGAGVQFRF